MIDPGYRFIYLHREAFLAISPTINEKLSSLTKKTAEPPCKFNETRGEGSCGFTSSCYEIERMLTKEDPKSQHIFSTRIGTEENGVELELDVENMLVDSN